MMKKLLHLLNTIIFIRSSKKDIMKLFIPCVLFLLFAGFSSCENHMDIRDIAHGTPSNADTVMPHRFTHGETDSTNSKALPRVYKR